MASKARAFQRDLSGAESSVKDELQRSAREFAEIYGLPDFDSETVVYVSIPAGDPVARQHWPIARQMAMAVRNVEWLLAVAGEANWRMKDGMKPAGNRADPHLTELIRSIDDLTRDTAADPRNPYYDNRAETEEGELLDLLRTYLWAVGLPEHHDLDKSALLGRWQRAFEDIS